jgi:hypothetical protein
MPRSIKSKNPFYALLVVMGIAFALTATAYCVMAIREVRAPAAADEVATAPHPLMTWMHDNGDAALLSELALLGVFVVAAITTDDYWQRRATNRR